MVVGKITEEDTISSGFGSPKTEVIIRVMSLSLRTNIIHSVIHYVITHIITSVLGLPKPELFVSSSVILPTTTVHLSCVVPQDPVPQ